MEVVHGIQKNRNITRGSNRLPKRAYYCPKCNQWHLTSIRIKNKTKSNAMKRELMKRKKFNLKTDP